MSDSTVTRPDPVANPEAAGPAASTVAEVAAAPQPSFPVHRSWKVVLIVTAVMALLAMLGVGLSTAAGPRSGTAYVYWVCLVPLYGSLCVWSAYTRSGGGQGFRMAMAWRQVWHWLGVGIALGLDYMIRGTGEESGMGAGMVALLVLALGCYLAGVHVEWPFIVVGALLSLTLVVVAEAEQYLWLIFVAGVLSVLLMLGLARLTRPARPEKVPTL